MERRHRHPRAERRGGTAGRTEPGRLGRSGRFRRVGGRGGYQAECPRGPEGRAEETPALDRLRRHALSPRTSWPRLELGPTPAKGEGQRLRLLQTKYQRLNSPSTTCGGAPRRAKGQQPTRRLELRET